ncbi:hypothetical protein JCM8547_006196 [Rhodosporidiobolus lusitaniae]
MDEKNTVEHLVNPRASLLDLPVELIDYVFEFAYTLDPPTGAVSKALLPFHRRWVWSSIVVRSSLDGFVQMLNDKPPVCKFVESLSIVRSGDSSWSYHQEKYDEPLRQVLNLLPKLDRLSLTGSRLLSSAYLQGGYSRSLGNI